MLGGCDGNVEWKIDEVGGVLMPMRVACSRKGGSSTFFGDPVVHNVSIDHTFFSLAE
ncbi:MAG: hypothetical protein ABIK85_07665 [Candidatus Eisenbacteria bacterium]